MGLNIYLSKEKEWLIKEIFIVQQLFARAHSYLFEGKQVDRSSKGQNVCVADAVATEIIYRKGAWSTILGPESPHHQRPKMTV